MVRRRPADTTLEAVGHHREGLVRGGDHGRQHAAVWTSPDGQQWQRVAHNEETFGSDGHQQMSSVAAGGPGLVAVGAEDENGPNTAAGWTSSDGRNWSRPARGVDEAGRQQLSAVAEGDGRLIAVGADVGAQSATVWIGHETVWAEW